MSTNNDNSQLGNNYSYGYKKDEVHDETVGGNNSTITYNNSKNIFFQSAAVDTQQARGLDRLERFYRSVFLAINMRPEDPQVTKDELNFIAENIYKEVLRNDPAAFPQLRRWLQQLYALAPDVFQVCVTILTSFKNELAPEVIREVERVRDDCQPTVQTNMPLNAYLERELTEHHLTPDESNKMREELTQLQLEVNNGNVQPVRQLLLDLTNALPGMRQPLRNWLVESTEVPTAIKVFARNYLDRL